MTSLLSRTGGGGDGCTNRPDLDDEGGGEEVGRYIELSRGPFAATRTPTYGTNNRINFTAGTRSLILHGNAPREGSNKRADSFRSSLYRSGRYLLPNAYTLQSIPLFFKSEFISSGKNSVRPKLLIVLPINFSLFFFFLFRRIEDDSPFLLSFIRRKLSHGWNMEKL